MSTKELKRLRTFQNMTKRAFHPSVSVVSRRSSKHPSVGKVLSNSRVMPQVNMERVFNKPGWVKQSQFDRWGNTK